MPTDAGVVWVGGLPRVFAAGVRLKSEPSELSKPPDELVALRPDREDADFDRVVLRPGGLPRLLVLRVDDTLRLVLLYVRVVSLLACLGCRVRLVSLISEGL
jgi:hypothetical protein